MNFSRRTLIGSGILAATATAALAAFGRLRSGCKFKAPDTQGLLGIGEWLNYSALGAITRNAKAREFDHGMISDKPFANPTSYTQQQVDAMEAAGPDDWKLTVDGLVAKPSSFTIAQLKQMPRGSQITETNCEEGWSYVAEWAGTPLAAVLHAVAVKPEARYAVYFSTEKGWWDSIDMDEAMHSQTLLAWEMNGGKLPVAFGGPLRLRVPRQLGYKSLKFISRIHLTDDLKKIENGLGSPEPEFGYAWYAGV